MVKSGLSILRMVLTFGLAIGLLLLFVYEVVNYI